MTTTVPTPNPTVPANLAGTLAGVAATMAVGFLTHAGYLALAAAAIGVPEATMSVVAMAVIGGAVNFGVTHIATLKTIDNIYQAIPTIHTYAEYPATPMEKLIQENHVDKETSNLTTKDGTPVV